MKLIKYIPILFLITLFASCEKAQDPPSITSITPEIGAAEDLIVIEGVNLENITEMKMSDQVINFNTAYNSMNALLFRVPNNVPLGEHVISLTTSGGVATVNFKITLEAPAIFNVNPAFASPGDVIEITGKNFFEPVEVFFFDGVQAEIKSLFQDSMEVIVPEGIQKGQIRLVANGGDTLSPIDFFSINEVLVSDFDGNGLREDNAKWAWAGFCDQPAEDPFASIDFQGIDGNYMKISGTDTQNFQWLGGPQSYFGMPGDDFETFGITTIPNNTLLEIDVYGNGDENAHLLFILQEFDGSTNDFTEEIHVDWQGWQKVSIPLIRFNDLDNFTIDPAKVKLLKIHLLDNDETGEQLEVAVDNIKFVEIL